MLFLHILNRHTHSRKKKTKFKAQWFWKSAELYFEIWKSLYYIISSDVYRNWYFYIFIENTWEY